MYILNFKISFFLARLCKSREFAARPASGVQNPLERKADLDDLLVLLWSFSTESTDTSGSQPKEVVNLGFEQQTFEKFWDFPQ